MLYGAATTVLLTYIDESYNDGCYWFGAVLVPESTDAAFQREILSIAPRYARHGIATDEEIHGYPLWNQSDGWAALAPRLLVDVMRRTLRTIARSGAQVIFVGVDRHGDPKLDKLDQARAFAVDQLLECIEDRCGPTGVNERCLLIFDEETSTAKELFTVVHAHHRATLLSGIDPAIVERPVMTPSHDTPGIQVADVAVFLRRRQHVVTTESDDRAHRARTELLDIVQPTLLHEIRP